MTSEARKFLDDLDDLVVRGGDTSREVMAVLTALRSRDTDAAFDRSEDEKRDGTILIRRAALPKTAAIFDTNSNLAAQVGHSRVLGMTRNPNNADGKVIIRGYNDHFDIHTSMAAKVLGLKVDTRA